MPTPMLRNQGTRRLVLCLWLVMGSADGICSAQDATPAAIPAAATPADEPASGADPAALERIRQAAAALREAQTLTFRIKTAATGMLTNGSPVVDFSIKMRRDPELPASWDVRISGEGRRRPAENPQQVEAFFNSDRVTWVDHTAKQVITKAVRSARGQALQLVYAGRVTEVMGEDPLAKESAAAEAVIEGQAEFDGVMCDIVVLRTRAKSARTKWWFGQSDHLPRKIEKSVESATMGGSSTVEFLDVRAGSPVSAADMDVPTPEGFSLNDTSGSPRVIAIAPKPKSPPPDAADTGEIDDPAARPITPPAASDGLDTEPSDPPAPPTATPAQPTTSTSPARPADDGPVDLQLTGEDGTPLALASLRGRPVVLFFMGSWSLPSRAALPELERLRVAFGGEISMLALAVRERHTDKFGEFVKGQGAALRIIPRGDEAARQLDVRIAPAIVLLDSDGVVHKTIQPVKKADLEELEQTIKTLARPAGAVGTERSP